MRHNGKSDCWFTHVSARIDEDRLETASEREPAQVQAVRKHRGSP